MRAALHVTSNLRVTIRCKKKYKQRWKKISRKKRINTTKSTLHTGADERKRNMRINSHGFSVKRQGKRIILMNDEGLTK